MKITKEEEIEKLEKLIKNGKWNYVTKLTLFFGIFMTIFMTLYQKYIIGTEIDLFTINLNIIVYMIGGFILGLWSWRSINKKLKKLKK